MEVTKEVLESVVNDFAKTIIDRKKLVIRPEQVIITLEDDVPYDVILRAGNPVVIKVRMALFAEAFQKKQFIDFKQLLTKSLETAPKMLRTLALVPVCDIISRNMEMKKWLKQNKIPHKYPELIPIHHTKVTVTTTVKIQHRYNDISVEFTSDKLTAEQLNAKAREALAWAVDKYRGRQDDD